jgi:hypothetical protein
MRLLLEVVDRAIDWRECDPDCPDCARELKEAIDRLHHCEGAKQDAPKVDC